MAIATLGAFSSCQDDFDEPKDAMQPPVASLVPNTTIFDLKREFWDDATNYIKKIETKEDGSHYIVAGRVITTDEPGNIFKSITIQDETAALTFSVNTYNLFLRYRVGQELVVDLTGLNIGKYNGLQQIGEPEWYESGNAWEATFMSPQVFYNHVQANGLPEADKVIVHNISSISDIPSGADGLCAWQSQLVRLNNVTFSPQVNTTTGETVYTFGLYEENFNQKVVLDGTELTLRTSGYSDFFNEKMPTEACDMTCFLSYYGSSWQLQLIDIADIENIGNPTLPSGTEENPWLVDEAIAKIQANNAAAGWTRGYIVGTVAPEVTNITSNDDIEWGAEATLANTVIIAPSADCTDFSQCIAIALPQGSTMRKYVALKDHPENLGKQLDVYGTLGTYLGTYGITDNNGTSSEFHLEGVDVPADEDTPSTGGGIPEGNGSEASPYNPTQVVAMGTSVEIANQWVTGYIVGWVDGANQNFADENNCFFSTPASSTTNVLLAATPGETNYKNCCVVNLPSKSEARSAINLSDNPENLGKVLTIKGTIKKYFAIPGLREPSEFSLSGEGGSTPTPPASSGIADGEGSKASPYNPTQVVAMGTDANVADQWVKGYIVGWVDNSNQTYADEKNCNFGVPATVNTNVLLATTPDETDYTKCCVVNLPNSNNIRATINLVDHPENLGKAVTVNGTIRKYFAIPGVRDLKSATLDESESGSTTPTPDTNIFTALSEDATETDWTFQNITMPSELTYIWQWKSYSEKYYLNASAFANATNYAAEAYAVSPVIDLTAQTSAKLTFSHAAKFQTTLTQLCGLVVREAGTTNWTELAIPTWPAPGAWTFVSSGEIDLKAFVGKKIEIAFKYGSSSEGADTWEIKNLVITK